MKKTKVLHVVGMMNRGGAETMLMNIFRHIDRDKFGFSFLTHAPDPGGYDSEIKELGGALYSISSLGTLGYLSYILTLRRFLRENGPFDIVHSHIDWQGGAVAVAARLAGVKNVIVHSHSSSWCKADTFPYRLLHRFNRLLVSSCAREGWACSGEAAEFLFSKGVFHSGRYRKICNAIDLDRYRSLTSHAALTTRGALGIPETSIVIGHVGSFSKVKNQTFLIHLAAALKQKGTDFRLVLVGDGTTKQSIAALADSHDLSDQVVFLGLRDDIPECMNLFDVFVFPSLYEGLGIVAIEAQAAGIPCLVSDQVPGEVDMGLGLVRHLPLDSAQSWLAALADIREQRCHNRSLIEKEITIRGYNIGQSVKEVMGFYQRMCEEPE